MARLALVVALLLPSATVRAQDALAPVTPTTTPATPRPAATHAAEAPAAPVTSAATAAVVAPAAVAVRAPATPTRTVSPQAREVEAWIGPLVLGVGGLALLVVAIAGAAQVGCDATTCTELDAFPFTLDLVGGSLLLAAGIGWWLLGGDRVTAGVPAGMSGAANVI